MRLFFLFCLLSIGLDCFSQVDTLQPPYKRFPTVPPFKVMLKDSSYYEKKNLPKNKAVWFMIFGPDCDHCQEETRQIIAHQKELKDVQVVMITLHPVDRMRTFIADYKLDAVKNVVVGQDYARFTMPFFGFKNFPFHALYDKKGKLLASFEGTMGITQVIDIFKKG
jgi:thiol-disulfide isomerase/thioredoxin